MLSILIPIYNWDVRKLVQDLHRQGEELSTPFEILALDDHSDPHFHIQHQALNLPYLRYERLSENIGRSAIRNRLAREARYAYLLFMDCDSGVPRNDFLEKYHRALAPDTVLCGGRIYADRPPADPALRLHWWVGKSREQKTAAERNRFPHRSFMTNNYLIPRKIQLTFPFEEALRQYGHEDTLFGMQLSGAGVAVRHLDNPLEHLGLEPTDEFLRKSRQAIRNLVFLQKKYPALNTKLLDTARRLEKFGLDRLFLRLYRRKREQWEKQLHRRQPALALFDLWKLGVLLAEKRA